MEPPTSGPPIVTLTTDFGWDDSYVAEMKAVLWRWAPPETRVVDVTHSIPPQGVMAAAFVLGRTVGVYPKGSIHMAVVDPGVGSQRRALVATIDERLIVCPDNGLITWAVRWNRGTFEACEITWRPSGSGLSRTFQGRDLFAPVAGMLARDPAVLGTIARTITDPVLLPVTLAAKPLTGGSVVYIDHFGNAVTNVNAELLSDRPSARVIVEERDLGPVRQTYADVAEGQALALVGSSGMLEIAVRNASAAQMLAIRVGDVVRFV
jgi:S-adenosylmethionine hydrolase